VSRAFRATIKSLPTSSPGVGTAASELPLEVPAAVSAHGLVDEVSGHDDQRPSPFSCLRAWRSVRAVQTLEEGFAARSTDRDGNVREANPGAARMKGDPLVSTRASPWHPNCSFRTHDWGRRNPMESHAHTSGPPAFLRDGARGSAWVGARAGCRPRAASPRRRRFPRTQTGVQPTGRGIAVPWCGGQPDCGGNFGSGPSIAGLVLYVPNDSWAVGVAVQVSRTHWREAYEGMAEGGGRVELGVQRRRHSDGAARCRRSGASVEEPLTLWPRQRDVRGQVIRMHHQRCPGNTVRRLGRRPPGRGGLRCPALIAPLNGRRSPGR
jgi:hypothetical protein